MSILQLRDQATGKFTPVPCLVGPAGKDGNDGTSITVKSITESTADGGSNIVTFSDGSTISIKNGNTGERGIQGIQGKSIFTTNVEPDAHPDGYWEYALTGSISNAIVGDIIICEQNYNIYKATLQVDSGFIGTKIVGNIKGPAGAKGATGETGQRGTGLLPVTTGPSSYTTAVGNITPKYRLALSTIKTQSGATEVLLGDTVRYSYYHYPIAYLDTDYAYFTTRTSIRGATGAAGAAGTTPVKGTDYFTEADKAELVAAVKASLNTESWTFSLEDGSTVTKAVYVG